VRNVTIVDVKRWYREWRAPTQPGSRERVRRAHGAVATLRMVLYFAAALGYRDCEQLATRLSNVKFERPGAREQEMNYGQVTAFVRTALDLGQRGVMPEERARYMAIAVAAQFELMLRQTDIIGQWTKGEDGRESWAGFFTWENVPGWRWRMRTSKSKYRAAAEFDLSIYGLLFPLLQAVPHEERAGAIVKGEHALPMRASSFGKWFRQIRAAAGIPADVQNRDTRAGGATEGDDAGVAFDDLMGALTHSRKETTLRYIRRQKTRIATVARARQASRGSEGQ
jgi:hypothetical protein